MIQVFFKNGTRLSIDADTAVYREEAIGRTSSSPHLLMLVLLKGDQAVGKFAIEDIAGWCEEARVRDAKQ